MITVNNLKVNKEAVERIHKRSNGKKRFLKLVATTLVLTIVAGGAIFGANKIVDNINENQIQVITQYYGEDSTEKKIIDYIGVSERLQSLDLDNYDVNEGLYEQHSIENELLDPITLNNLIDEFKGMPSFILTKNIIVQDRNIFLTLTLKKQEKLVNEYIYHKGYSTAHNNVSDATKKYTAETFGIENPNDIILSYQNIADGEFALTVTNHKDTFNNESYTIDGFFDKKQEKEITAGVVDMINTDTQYDHDETDNYKYNRQRNVYIKNALEKSVELENEVNNNDLYNSKLAGKLK